MIRLSNTYSNEEISFAVAQKKIMLLLVVERRCAENALKGKVDLDSILSAMISSTQILIGIHHHHNRVDWI